MRFMDIKKAIKVCMKDFIQYLTLHFIFLKDLQNIHKNIIIMMLKDTINRREYTYITLFDMRGAKMRCSLPTPLEATGMMICMYQKDEVSVFIITQLHHSLCTHISLQIFYLQSIKQNLCITVNSGYRMRKKQD